MKNGDRSRSLGMRKKTPVVRFCILRRDVARRMTKRARTFLACVAVLVPASVLLAQTLKYSKPPDAKKGEVLYKNGCIACHGSTGKGAPQTSTEFVLPDTFPDFTRCDQTTAETNLAYKDVVIHGGRVRGLSLIMPAFGELLT